MFEKGHEDYTHAVMDLNIFHTNNPGCVIMPKNFTLKDNDHKVVECSEKMKSYMT